MARRVRITNFTGHGFGEINGEEVDVVPIPSQYKKRYPRSVWVFNKKRNEPIRLLSGEFEFIQ